MLQIAEMQSSSATDGNSTESNLRRNEAPRFIGHPMNLHPQPDVLLSTSATVCLWRLRTEWKRVSRIDGMASLSKIEAARVARFPKSPLSKRFAIERASLRKILSGLTGISAAEIEFAEYADGRLGLAPQHGDLSIAITHVGLWTVIGVSRSRIGLASAAAAYRGNDIHQTTEEVPMTRAHVRQLSLHHAGITADMEELQNVMFDDGHATYLFDACSEGRWHVLDLPMPGSNMLALSAPYPIERGTLMGGQVARVMR
ncbi:hypothetical protein AWB80_08255 [Caballeronia pedi]|uniref:4'-phosphopantetheinyl transferase domain-containing protein n=1 Tax=Caballeronia pedi TaxID=1777141 RepID=A0A158E5C6_9BURK|nr:hypothetical protein [Caballeronia pedi]SAL02014.1 hypothetical protein AWB80_08255 [Caballeronia pedi]